MIDVSVVHPTAETYVQDAANTDGAAAAARSARKVKKYSCGQAGGSYDFEPVIVETYGRQGVRRATQKEAESCSASQPAEIIRR